MFLAAKRQGRTAFKGRGVCEASLASETRLSVWVDAVSDLWEVATPLVPVTMEPMGSQTENQTLHGLPDCQFWRSEGLWYSRRMFCLIENGFYRCCAKTLWSLPWLAETHARLSGRLVWSTMLSSGFRRSPSQSPRPFSAARAPVSATGNCTLCTGRPCTLLLFNPWETVGGVWIPEVIKNPFKSLERL